MSYTIRAYLYYWIGSACGWLMMKNEPLSHLYKIYNWAMLRSLIHDSEGRIWKR